MNEIQFRIWDNTNKIMYYESPKTKTGLQVFFDENMTAFDSYEGCHDLPSEEFIPLQYIGLKDKKGKKVFIGGVVLMWGVEVLIEDLVHVHYLMAECMLDGTCEIIGNIYENPGMVTRGKK